MLQEYRCLCGKLLFKGLLLLSIIEIKCKRCDRMQLIREMDTGLMKTSSFTILFDEQGSIVNASKNASISLGYNVKELLDLRIHELNPAITLAFYRRLWKARHQHPPFGWRKKVFYKNKTGDVCEFSAQFGFLNAESTPYFFVILEPISKSTDGAYISDGSWFGESQDEFLLEIDDHGILTHINTKAENILGYDSASILNQPINNLCPLLRNKESCRNLILSSTQGKPFEIKDNIFVLHNGQELTAESHFISNYVDGKFSGFRIFNWVIPSSVLDLI